jgi:hypothetical protein
MTESVQKFLLKNTKFLQKLVNEKLSNGGFMPNFFKWMQIGKRNNGDHYIFKYFKVLNHLFLAWGYRWNFARPHVTKWLFSREKEVLITGYAVLFVALAFWTRKNRVRPLFQYSDAHLYHYDNPENLKHRFGVQIPYHYTKYRVSAHYLEINKIFQREMMKKLEEYEQEVTREFENSSEKEKRTKFITNPNYVYEPFGWEIEEQNNL